MEKINISFTRMPANFSLPLIDSPLELGVVRIDQAFIKDGQVQLSFTENEGKPPFPYCVISHDSLGNVRIYGKTALDLKTCKWVEDEDGSLVSALSVSKGGEIVYDDSLLDEWIEDNEVEEVIEKPKAKAKAKK